MKDKVIQYIREHELMRAGDRVVVAVSGGADSVALLRVLLELKDELGIVLSVAHFNHKIRGTEAQRDEDFVGALAHRYGLQFLRSSGDVPQYAESENMSLEAAGRELRYGYFRSLLESGEADKVATAHTADDQAETVLMRLIRGAGTKGLAGIHPIQWAEKGLNTKADTKEHEGTRAIVRPMLGVRRREVEAYLQTLGQDWREDASNRDQRHLRNRIRHSLLPLLERDFNPGVVDVLADVAEIARGEEEYWDWLVSEWLAEAKEHGYLGKGAVARQVLNVLATWPLAMQRRVYRAVAEEAGARLEFPDVERVRKLASGPSGKELEVGEAWRVRHGPEGLRFERAGEAKACRFEHSLPVPGEVRVPELGTVVKAYFVASEAKGSGYNPAKAWDPKKLAAELVVRNWRAGDRFWPAHSKSEKKLKELLQERRVPTAERSRWPVAVSRERIVWVRGFPPGRECLAEPDCRKMVVIEEIAGGQDKP
ncbi:MAG: tRNA lysidine(34) synthetase TilS [Acidobacteriia bacterium]|nr:tRNA lysidine(34) synthetase TilS [Terriglobia bacterium]